jgi:hypothetical protein
MNLTSIYRLGSAAAFNAAGAVNAAVAAVVLVALVGRVFRGTTSSSTSSSSSDAAVAGQLSEDVLLGSWGLSARHALQLRSTKSERS